MSRDGRDGGVAVYVTSHGFGHLNRSAAVINRIPRGIPVSIRSHASLFDYWRQRVTRPIELGEFVSDSGAVNPPGDSNTTDGPASIALAIRVRAEAMARLDEEVDWLRKQRITAIACDAPSVPLVAAHRAAIPGYVMSNFTWADIYAPHARALGGDALRLIADLRADYRHATALFRMQPSLTMSWLKPAIDVGLVVNQGRKRRAELVRSMGLSRGDRVVYLYIGRYGQLDMDWARLERFGERGIHFVGYDPAPGVGPRNLHVVPSPDWPGGDLIASTDAVVAKAGYSTVGEAMASGTPMIYAPRRGFAEYRSLDQALRSWEGGMPVSSRDFQGFRLEAALDKALAIRPGPPPFPADGAARIARHLAQACRDPRRRSDCLEGDPVMKLVIHPAVEAERLGALQAAAPGAEWCNAADEAEAVAAMPGAEAVIGKITPAMLAAADRLRWVQTFTASLEHYMFPALEAHACVLTNVRGLFGDVIADQVMGYVLCFARNLHTYIRRQVQHRYEPIGGESARVSNVTGPGVVNAMDRATIYLPDATMGIVGMGGIGCDVARRARAFGISVRGVDRFPDRVKPPEGVESVDGINALPELLGWADFAVIAAPQTPETTGWFDARTLAHLRSSSYLINIGRGAIVVLDDLVEALRAGRLAGAALDVFQVEPLPADHPLWDFPNVILTPHTAGYSPVIAGRHLSTLVENVGRFARGEPLINVVDKSLWF